MQTDREFLDECILKLKGKKPVRKSVKKIDEDND